MDDVWIRIRIRLRTALRAALLFTDISDLQHSMARREKDEARARELRAAADDDSDSAAEFNQAVHRINTGESEP